MRFIFFILYIWIFSAYSFEIYSNYPLPENNIKEVHNSLEKKEDIVEFMEKTDCFLKVQYKNANLYLIRKPLIKDINIRGNSFFWDREIKGVCGIYEGKYISNGDFSLIPLKLKQFYFDNGFLDAKVFIDSTINSKGEATVNINIKEGQKFRIKDIKFISDRKISQNEKEKYKKILNLKDRDFNFQNIQRSLDNLLNYIKKEGYYDAFVSIFSFHRLNNKDVILYVNIVHGFYYQIKFTGNYKVSDKTLMELAEFQENGVNYYQIQKFAERIKDFYFKDGFLDADVDYNYSENINKKTAIINIYIYEGKRYKISDVLIKSDHKISKTVKEYIESLKGNFYKEEKIRDHIQNYIKNFWDIGYKNAYYILSYTKTDNNNLILEIEIYRGKKFIISSIKFEGYKPHIKIKAPLVYEGQILSNIFEKLKEELKNSGFLDGSVDLKIDLEEKKDNIYVYATYIIKTGKLYKTSVPFIYGTWNLKPEVVMWNIKENEPYTQEKVDSELNFLYTSYIFNFINPDTYINKEKAKVHEIFILNEDKRGLFQGSIGYNSIEKFKTSISLLLKNLFNYGFEFNSYLDVSSLNTNYNLSFGNRMLPKYSSLFFSVYHSLQSHKYYNLINKGFKIDYSKRPNKWMTQFLTLSYDRNKLKDTDVFIKNPYKKYMLYFGLTYDDRNNKTYPTDGFYFRANGGKTFGDVKYFFGNVSFRYYYKIFKFVFTQNFATGGNFITITKLPISERYFLGGFYTIRGFGYEEVSNNGTGGNSYAYINTDLRFPIFPSYSLYGFIFTDMGNVFESKKDYMRFRLRKTAGFGVMIPTPAGAFMFDYARILDRKEGEQKHRIEFSINVIF
jgi:outer membrane protein insertion porin family